MNAARSYGTRRDFRVAVPESTRRAIHRAEVRLGGRAKLLHELGVGENIVWDALTPMGLMRPETLDRVQKGLRAIGEEP